MLQGGLHSQAEQQANARSDRHLACHNRATRAAYLLPQRRVLWLLCACIPVCDQRRAGAGWTRKWLTASRRDGQAAAGCALPILLHVGYACIGLSTANTCHRNSTAAETTQHSRRNNTPLRHRRPTRSPPSAITFCLKLLELVLLHDLLGRRLLLLGGLLRRGHHGASSESWGGRWRAGWATDDGRRG